MNICLYRVVFQGLQFVSEEKEDIHQDAAESNSKKDGGGRQKI